MFNLALNGNMKAALSLQKSLNGNPGNSVVDVFAGYELQKLDGSGNPILDAYGNPEITALNLTEGTLVTTSDNQDIDCHRFGGDRGRFGDDKSHRQDHGEFFCQR